MGREHDHSGRFTRRALILGGVGTLGFAGLSARLYQLQILESGKYRGLSEENQFNFRLLVPNRGKILDRQGRVFATNVENYRLLLDPNQVKDLNALLERLDQILQLSKSRLARITRDFARRDPFTPIEVIDNMDWKTFAKINLWLPDLPGIQTDVGEVRMYPDGRDTAHLVGYVGRVSPEQSQEGEPLLRHPGFRIGRTGVEKQYDQTLRGKAGALKIEVNALGRVVRELPDVRTRAIAGSDIKLTLDKTLQATALGALEGTSGAACLLDLQNGQVRVLASTPSYDPNKFARGISATDYKALLDDPLKPLFNKAMGGAYPPASCFKPVVAMAAFDAGLADPKERIRCTGKIKLGDREFHCWKRRGHGTLNLNSAIALSCDIYFYELAKRLGIDRLHDAAIKLGFGELFDLGLGTGSSGLVPNQAWKRARFDLPWAQGETLITGIGQGYLAATPLQLAVMTARIATGRLIRPSLVMPETTVDQTPEKLGFSEEALSLAQKGMAAVVNEPWGTAFVPNGLDGQGMLWAGKSGTGQVRTISKAERDTRVIRNNELPWKLRDHALFVGYAPLDKPKFAASVVVEHGGGGSSHAAPKVRTLLNAALKQSATRLVAEGRDVKAP